MTGKSKFQFSGDYWQLFKILVKNFLLILVTLFLYAPWAMVNILKFYCSNLSYNNKYFEFTGTGDELFFDYFKFLLISISVGGLFSYCFLQNQYLALASVVLSIYILFFLPKYILKLNIFSISHINYDRTNFNMDLADRKEFIILWIRAIILGVPTLGMNWLCLPNLVMSYMINHTSFGRKRFYFGANNVKFFVEIILKNICFTILTLGLYLPWVFTSWPMFYVNHTCYHGRKFSLRLSNNLTVEIFIISFLLPKIVKVIPLPKPQGLPGIVSLEFLVLMGEYFLIAFGIVYYLKIICTHVQIDGSSEDAAMDTRAENQSVSGPNREPIPSVT